MLIRVFLDIAAAFAVLWGCYRQWTLYAVRGAQTELCLSVPADAEYEIRQAIRRARLTGAEIHVQIFACYDEIETIAAHLREEYPHITTERRENHTDHEKTERRE